MTMNLRRSVNVPIFLVITLFASLAVILAEPAFAANTCNGPGVTASQFPARAGAQSSLQVACTTNAGTKVDNITVADSSNAVWHHGAARVLPNVTLVAGATTITNAGFRPDDVRRPISGGCLKGGTFIVSVVGTTATLSQALGTPCSASSLTIEHTTSRVLTDATCTATLITSATAKFTSTDIGKSVSGGNFAIGARITAVGTAGANTTATVGATSPASGVCVDRAPAVTGYQAPMLTIGGATYAGATPIWSNDPMQLALTNTLSGNAFTCIGKTLTAGAATKAIVGTSPFNAAYAGLPVIIVGTSTVVTTVATATTTALSLVANCPAGITTSAGVANIGAPGANAPQVGNSLATLGAVLNLSPTLVATADECSRGQLEGFSVAGTWANPLSANGTARGYATVGVLGAATAPAATVGQIVFPTAVVSFASYVVPNRVGGIAVNPAGSHYEFVLPSLPTTLATCVMGSPALPSHTTAISFRITSSTLTTSPALPTGSGNPSDPAVRSLNPRTGSMAGSYRLRNGNTTVVSAGLTPCLVAVPTATATFNCGT